MTGLLRAEVTDQYGTVTEVIDLVVVGLLKPRERGELDRLAARLLRDLASLIGCDEGYARQIAIALLIRGVADEAAYERVCERKGILPL